MDRGWPILLVTHDDEEPRGWQLLNGRGGTEESASGIPVHVEHVIERDPSVAELADLLPGWRAWRNSETEPAQRAPEIGEPAVG